MRAAFRQACLLVLLVPGAALAQNLLPNNGFDTDLASWTQVSIGSGTGSAAWSSTDAAASPTSGSAQLTNTSANAGSTGDAVALRTCVAVTPGTTYSMNTMYFVAAGQGSVEIRENYNTFASADCTGGAAAIGGCFIGTTTGAWTSLGSCNFTPVVGVQSASITLITSKVAAGGSMATLFDNPSLVVATPVELQRFGAD